MHTGKPTAMVVSHCIAWFHTELVLTACQILRGFVEHHTVSRRCHLIFVKTKGNAVLAVCTHGEYLPRCMRGAGTGAVPLTLSSRASTAPEPTRYHLQLLSQ